MEWDLEASTWFERREGHFGCGNTPLAIHIKSTNVVSIKVISRSCFAANPKRQRSMHKEIRNHISIVLAPWPSRVSTRCHLGRGRGQRTAKLGAHHEHQPVAVSAMACTSKHCKHQQAALSAMNKTRRLRHEHQPASVSTSKRREHQSPALSMTRRDRPASCASAGHCLNDGFKTTSIMRISPLSSSIVSISRSPFQPLHKDATGAS